MKVDGYMSKTNKKIISVSVVALLVIVSLGVSFAYFTAGLTGGESASTINLGAGTLNIEFAGGNNISLNNIYPKAEPWGTKTFTVKGNNTTDLYMYYALTLVIDTNSFSNEALSFKLTSVNTNNNGSPVPSTAGLIKISNTATRISLGTDGYFKNATDALHTYQFALYFPETNENQNADQTKQFAAHIEIEPKRATESSTTSS